MTALEPDRRAVLAGLGGSLLVSARAVAKGRAGRSAVLNAWLTIAPDNTVVLAMSQSEMGQGISTTLPLALADELGADWSAVRTEWSRFDPAYRHPQYEWMFTGNSESVSTFYPIMRTMGAAAREMLTTAAAERLKVPAERLTVAGGVIADRATGRRLRFADVAEAAAKVPAPKTPKLKADADLKWIGRPAQRRDIPSKVDGSAVFGIDVKVPGMAVAAIRRAPSPGGVLVRYDAAALKAHPGVIDVVPIPSGLAVVADRYWTAKRALDAADLTFGPGPMTGYATEAQRADFRARLESGPFSAAKTVGDVPAALAQAGARTISAIYEVPAQAHATMEPMNCTAHVTADRCELWAPTQGMEVTHGVAKELTGLRDDQIVIHRTLLGGGFGRRLLADFAKIAIIVAKAAGRPVKVIWSREEDFRYDAYRPPMTHAIRAAIGPDGLPTALAHRVVSPSHMLFIFPRTVLKVPDGWDRPVAPPQAYDSMSVEGLVGAPYRVANLLVEQHRAETPLTVSVWRTTGHGPNNFALESFVDELAHAAGQDPLAYRLALTDDPRARAVLEAVAEMCGGRAGPPAGTARGLGLAKAFGGYIAQVAEISADGKDLKVRRVWSAVDCGRVLDPGIATSNVEGGVVWGLSGLRTEATFAGGEIEQTNFDRFEPLHLWETPQIITRLMPSQATSTGVGELGPVPTHAAVGNAIFAATGERIRSLPLSRAGYRLT